MKPKKLYRFYNKNLNSHIITETCKPVQFENGIWQCKHPHNPSPGTHEVGTVYGEDTLKKAKKEERDLTKKQIKNLQSWLKKLDRYSIKLNP